MIVSITLTSKVLDVLDVLDVVGGGGGSDLPPVGISPAKIEVDSAHMSASAIANRFMGVSSFEVLRKMPTVYIKNNGTQRQDFLQGRLRANYYPVCIRSTSSPIESLKSHADDLSEAGSLSPYSE